MISFYLFFMLFSLEWHQDNWTGGPGHETLTSPDVFLLSTNMDYFHNNVLKIGDWGWFLIGYIENVSNIERIEAISSTKILISGTDRGGNKVIKVSDDGGWEWRDWGGVEDVQEIGEIVYFKDRVYAPFNFSNYGTVYGSEDGVLWTECNFPEVEMVSSLCSAENILYGAVSLNNTPQIIYTEDPYERWEVLDTKNPPQVPAFKKIVYSALKEELAAFVKDSVFLLSLSAPFAGVWRHTNIPDAEEIEDIIYVDKALFVVGKDTEGNGAVWRHIFEWNKVFSSPDFSAFLSIEYDPLKESIFVSGVCRKPEHTTVFFSKKGESWDPYGWFLNPFVEKIVSMSQADGELYVIDGKDKLFKRMEIGRPFMFSTILSSIYDTQLDSAFYTHVKVDANVPPNTEIELRIASLSTPDPSAVDWSTIDPIYITQGDIFYLTEYNGIHQGDRYVEYFLIMKNYENAISPEFYGISIFYTTLSGEEFEVNYDVKEEPQIPGDTIGVELKVIDPEGLRKFKEIRYEIVQEEEVVSSSSYFFEEPQDIVYLNIPTQGTQDGEMLLIFDCLSNFNETAHLEIPFTLAPPPDVIENLLVFPNPSKLDKIYLNFLVRKNGVIYFELYSPDGVKVYSYKEHFDSGEFVEWLELPVFSLPSGTYILILRFIPDSGEEKIYKKTVGVVR